jgi:DDE family transposase
LSADRSFQSSHRRGWHAAGYLRCGFSGQCARDISSAGNRPFRLNQPKTATAIATTGSCKPEIVKRSERHRFIVLAKRWIVERTFAWISRHRRQMRDFERYARSVAAFIRLATIRIMLRRLPGQRIQGESQLPGSALTDKQKMPPMDVSHR